MRINVEWQTDGQIRSTQTTHLTHTQTQSERERIWPLKNRRGREKESAQHRSGVSDHFALSLTMNTNSVAK